MKYLRQKEEGIVVYIYIIYIYIIELHLDVNRTFSIVNVVFILTISL